MGQMVRMKFIMWTVVYLILLGAFTARADNLRRIVVFLDGTPLPVQQAVVQQSGSRVLHVLSLITALAIELPPLGTASALAILQGSLVVLGVYNDDAIMASSGVTITPAAAPPTEQFPWGLGRIGIPAVFNNYQNAAASTAPSSVAILDTGIATGHPELWQNIVGGYNARADEDPSDYEDDNGHGTHIAGIITAAWNGQGIIGAASHARVVAVKVLDATGSGYVSDLIQGLQWVRGRGVRLVNMSLGFPTDSPPLHNAIKRLYKDGAIMVASAGNFCTDGAADEGGGADSGCDPSQDGIHYPARYPEVIAVGATDVNNQVPTYSRSGPELDLVAPGGSQLNERILSTNLNSGYGLGSGTSQAAAHVSGAIAVALQLRPQLSFTQVLSTLQATAQNLGYAPEQQGAGLINVPAMIQALH